MDVPRVRENRRTWEAIAEGFDATRTRPWPPVASFLWTLPPGARLLDAGCGNGRHLEVALSARLRPVGLDFSRGLLAASRRRATAAGLVAGLLERPPLRPGSFDAILCAAAAHHVRGRAQRVAIWRGLRSIARPNAPLLVTVWALEQPRFQPPPRAPEGPHEDGDAFVPWGHGGLDEQRFVHLYASGELGKEVGEAGWHVEREWSEALGGAAADNHLALARATQRL